MQIYTACHLIVALVDDVMVYLHQRRVRIGSQFYKAKSFEMRATRFEFERTFFRKRSILARMESGMSEKKMLLTFDVKMCLVG